MDIPPVPTLERKRAAALPPEARRQAIVDATLPLLMQQGLAVTTRQIAEAAGIAEGTIFRVFPDKDTLIAAAVEQALDPAPLEARLAEIDPTLPLVARLVEAVTAVQERSERLWQLMSNVGFTGPARDRDEMRRRNMADLASLVALFEPDRKALRFDPVGNARRLRALAIAGSHPALAGDEPLSPQEIVSLFLDGARKPATKAAALMLKMLWRLLRSHLRAYKRELWLVVLFQGCQTIATLMLPALNANIIDNGVVTGDTHYIWSEGALMLAVTFVQVCFAIAAVYFGSRAAMGFGRDVRRSLFHTVTDYSAREVAGFGASSLITRVTNDVQQVQMLVQMSCTLLIAAPMMIVGGVILAVREDGALSSLLLVSVPVMIVAVGSVVFRMVPQFQAMQDRIDKVNGILREQITGIRVVRAFVREPDEARRFAGGNQLLTDTSLRAGHLMAFMFPTVMLILNLSSAAAVWIGGNRIAAGQMQVGALIAFLSYLIQILMALMMATFIFMLLPRAAVCSDRIQEVLDTPSTVTQPESPVHDLPGHGLLELRDVGFRYPRAEAPVLSGVSFTVRAGETTAIVGSTGAGKTTLLNLIPRMFDVTSGEVLVDGVDVREIDMHTMWSRIGLVPQRPYLFSGTIASNLRYGDPDATDEELWQALEIAQARDFVSAMQGGLEARIDQGGTNVSGGQRQRLAIARALVRKPDIYLFDDSFSALDLATDARLRAALAPYTLGAAKVIVAQRVSTILHADQILVLEDGAEVGLGTHQELLASCPTYVEIVASQMSDEEAA